MKSILAAVAAGMFTFAPVSAANITFTFNGVLNGQFTLAETNIVSKWQPDNPWSETWEVDLTDEVRFIFTDPDRSWSGNPSDRIDYINFWEGGGMNFATEWNQMTFDGGSPYLVNGGFVLGTHRLDYYGVATPTILTITSDAVVVPPVGDPGAVPEPATWATMILGFALVGGALRRPARRAIDAA